MSTEVRAFTVPGEWGLHKDTFDETPQKIVGVGYGSREFWLPSQSSYYSSAGGYHLGYDVGEVDEITIDLGTTMSGRMMDFFSGPLSKWCQTPRTAEKYDCHWFAFYMVGVLAAAKSTKDSLDMADEFIQRGQPGGDNLDQGQLGVIGLRNLNRVSAEHSIIGLGDGTCLQVFGMHDVVAITSQDITVEYYEVVSAEQMAMTGSNYGLFIS